MKSTFLNHLLILSMLTVSCGEQTTSAKSTITVKVMDEAGKTLEGITVRAGYFDKITNPEGFGSAAYKFKEALTNHEGVATVSNNSRGSTVGIGLLNTNGFYEDYGYEYEYKSQSSGIWQPDNPLIEFKLKPIKNPVAMYAKYHDGKVPEYNKACSYDLEAGDWLAPHGKGKTADLIFTFKGTYKAHNEFDCQVSITFANPHDGAIGKDLPERVGSFLRLDHTAPTDGYVKSLTKTYLSTPEKPMEHYENNSKMNYYLRLRTVVDENNQIISANYGKVK